MKYIRDVATGGLMGAGVILMWFPDRWQQSIGLAVIWLGIYLWAEDR